MTVTVRRATGPDAPFLAEMLVQAAFWRPEKPQGSVQDVLADPQLAHYVQGWPRAGDLGVVAEDGPPVGAAWLRLLPRDEAGYGFVDDDIPELTIGVRAGHRGRGVGTALLRELLALAQHEGLQRVSLSVERDNPALDLYRRLGFTEVGGHPGAPTLLWTA